MFKESRMRQHPLYPLILTSDVLGFADLAFGEWGVTSGENQLAVQEALAMEVIFDWRMVVSLLKVKSCTLR
ncbi:hypothetical protein TNCV_1005231 [Trichonephila clavipes]|nr:hypothetical protein TNCV_1005231 [Trichonephila clavipes]